MVVRNLAIFALFVVVAAVPALLGPRGTPAAPPPSSASVPAGALQALGQGRYRHASRILREYLAAVPDTTPALMLLAARTEAARGRWSAVEGLLAGRSWLDSMAGGYGWNLLARGRIALGHWAAGGAALDRYLAVASGAGDRARGLAELRRALALSAAGEAGAAREAFDRAAQLVPQIGDWIALFAAQAAAELGDTLEVERQLDVAGPLLAREWGWRARVRAFRNAGDLARALEVAEDAAGSRAEPEGRAEAWVVAGELQLLRGDTTAAEHTFRQAIGAAPGRMAGVDAARKLSDLPGLTVDDRLRVGRLYLRHGNLSRAVEGLEAYLASGAGSAYERAEIRLQLGRALYHAGRYSQAEQRLLDLADDDPPQSMGAEALYLVGRAQYRQGRDDAARATFLRAAERYPTEAASAKALFFVADLAHDAGRIDTARAFYRRAIETRPDLDEAGLARMRLAGIELLNGRHEAAARILDAYRREYPEGRRVQQATYWSARAYRELGDQALARDRLRDVRRLDPFSYYGIRAAELLGEPFLDAPLEPQPSQDVAADAAVRRAFGRIDLLRELDREDAVAFEVDRVKERLTGWDAALYALAEGFNARGLTVRGIQVGWEIFDRDPAWNLRLLRIIYPFPYRELIVAEARERDLDPFLVAGLIRQESMFKAGAASSAGAIGLMQIMPNTGHALASALGVHGFGSDSLREPEINVRLGMAYMVELMQRFGERLPAVLAAYNAGPARVARWSRLYPEYGDVELFAERIPYGETRHYVKTVQQNARLYAALYETRTAAPEGE